jgi:glycosyltransferase involved in cell wall biosynthesis
VKIGLATSDWGLWNVAEGGAPSLGGAGWYRVGLPARALRAAGHEVVIGVLSEMLLVDRATRRSTGSLLAVQEWAESQPVDRDAPQAMGTRHVDCDVVIIQRYMHGPQTIGGLPNEGLAEGIAKARRMGQVVINDVDDWFWGIDPRNRAFFSVNATNSPDHNINHYRRILAASDAVTASTPYLAERLRSMLPCPVHVLRNLIDLDSFRVRPQPKGNPIVGWAGAMAWRSGDVEQLRGILGSFMAANGLRGHHSGHAGFVQHDGQPYPTFAEAAGIGPDVVVSTSGMVNTDNIAELYAWFNVGLVPLNPKPFNMAKSAIKGMEMAASGIPFVASDTPEYRWAEAQGMGRVARRPADWKALLTKLLSHGYRVEQAEQGRKAVETHDWRARGPEWVHVIEALAS